MYRRDGLSRETWLLLYPGTGRQYFTYNKKKYLKVKEVGKAEGEGNKGIETTVSHRQCSRNLPLAAQGKALQNGLRLTRSAASLAAQ